VVRSSMSALARSLKTALRNHYDGFIDLKNHRSWTSLLIARLFRSRVKTGWNSDHFKPFHRDVREYMNQTNIKRRRCGESANWPGSRPVNTNRH